MATDIWIGHCYDVLYVNQFSLGDAEPYPLPSGTKRTGTKEGAAISINEANKKNWTKEEILAHTLQTSKSNTITSSHDYETMLRVAIETEASFGVYTGSLNTEVNSRVKNSLAQRKITTLTTTTRETKKVILLHEESASPPPLDSDFKSRLWSATKSQSAFDDFTSQYGTHFSSAVTFGGVGYQAFDFSAKSVAKLSELGVDTSVQASGVIKFVELNGNLENAVGINKNFLDEVEAQDTKIETLGGKSNANFENWLETVDSNPVPIKVSLIDHSYFLKSSFFRNKTSSEISPALDAFQNRLRQYIESNGKDLSSSIIKDGDQVCLCALSDEAGNNLPPMLAQLNNPASTQATLSELGSTVSVSEFISTCRKNDNYKPYVWTIKHVIDGKIGKSFDLEQLIELTNYSTGKELDGEGANPHHGWVSAAGAGKNIPLGVGHEKSNMWMLKERLGYFEKGISAPINSGDVIAIHRVYIDTSKADPAGFLQIRNSKAYSTGQLYGSEQLIETNMAFQLIKLNTTD